MHFIQSSPPLSSTIDIITTTTTTITITNTNISISIHTTTATILNSMTTSTTL